MYTLYKKLYSWLITSETKKHNWFELVILRDMVLVGEAG